MRVRVSAQFLLLERSWHRSQGKGGPNERPRTPAPGPITFRLRLGGTHPVLEDSDFGKERGWDLVPLRPAPDLIFFRLRLGGIYPVLEDSDGVGFEPTVGLPLLLISSQVH